MRKLFIVIILFLATAIPVNAMEFTAPEVPDSGREIFPEDAQTFSEGLWMILKQVISQIKPSISKAASSCLALMVITLIVSILKLLPGSTDKVIDFVAVLSIAIVLLQPTGTLIRLGTETVIELSEYGKLLLPVLTGVLAAQGGAVTSSAIYTGTMIFDVILSTMISNVIVPMIYFLLCICVADAAFHQSFLSKLKDFVKWLMTWGLKLILYIFTGYMSITGVVSGTADVAALKATKLTISGLVPVVGNLLADASESILVGASVMKSAVGIYGLLAILAVWIGPFLEIGAQYLLLKTTHGVCEIFSQKSSIKLIKDFSSAMGMLLAMTGTMCLLLLISVVCFIKGVG